LLLYKPATFKHSSIWLILAFANASDVISNRFDKFSKAFAVFLPAVFCEIIVTINVLNASLFEVVHSGIAKVFRSICKIFSAQFSVIY
jgi:hypothetical protein